MITLAEKLLSGSGAGRLKVEGYVEFVSSTPMTIYPRHNNPGVTLYYSLDAKNWTPIAPRGKTPSANIIYFIGQATKTKALYVEHSQISNPWSFVGATNLECNGKLDRLLQDTLGGDSDVLTLYDLCFSYMFYNTKTLIKAPELPATTLADRCYSEMFSECSSLTTPPAALPATTLARECYDRMFYRCTSLRTVPALPATTLADRCYNQMFLGCTSLTTTPALPATTLAVSCYQGMFHDCTSLTTPPKLPATTLADSCYADMFYNCSSLTTPPAIPATTVAYKCCYYMFNACTSLRTVPKLPATTLAEDCYQGMFHACRSLKLSETKTGIYDTAYRIPSTGTGTAARPAFSGMFSETGGTFTSTPKINTTYYTENTPV